MAASNQNIKLDYMNIIICMCKLVYRMEGKNWMLDRGGA